MGNDPICLSNITKVLDFHTHAFLLITHYCDMSLIKILVFEQAHKSFTGEKKMTQISPYVY